jgi:hypothetical protein
VEFEDIMEELQKLDEIQILELLDISTEDLLAAFEDKIEKRRAYLEAQLG